MSNPVTVIGAASRTAPAVTAPGGVAGPAAAPAVTVMPFSAPKTPPASPQHSPSPTAMPATEPAVRRQIAASQPSAVPGRVCTGVVVTNAELVAHFPTEVPATIQAIKAHLAGLAIEQMTTVGWLDYGVSAQADVNAVIKTRLSVASADAPRQIHGLFTRLQHCIQACQESLAGGFLRKSPRTVWLREEPEITQLEQAIPALVQQTVELIQTIEGLKQRCQAAVAGLRCQILAGEYVLPKLQPSHAEVLQSRLLALLTSQALANENQAGIDLDVMNLRELVLLAQDGVLVRLPGLRSQLAGLTDKPNDTQRFLAMEKLSDLNQLFERMDHGKP